MFLCCCFLLPLPLDCVLCPPAWMPLLTFTPTAVRPSRAFSSAITAAMLTFGTAGWQSDVDASVSAVNKTLGRRTLLQAVSVQSINFQDKHQIEKILFFFPTLSLQRDRAVRRGRRAEPGRFWGSADFVFNSTFKSSWEIPLFALLLRDSHRFLKLVFSQSWKPVLKPYYCHC